VAAWKLLLVAMKAQRTWQRIPAAQRRALLEQAQRKAKEHGPTVARAVRERGPVVAKRVGDAVRSARKRPGA
jgi:hypothetical protein